MNRRHFLKTTLAAAALPGIASAQTPPAKKRILLRSSWQTVNIGDIAHTPGMLALLEKHLPECEVTLWPSSVDNGVEEMLNKRFPKVKILGKVEGLKAEAFRTHDFLLHGSGPGIVGQKSIVEWVEKTGKPYGIGGVTWSYSDGGLEGDQWGEVRLLPRFRFARAREVERCHVPDHGVRAGCHFCLRFGE